jgi:hypothetical protein
MSMGFGPLMTVDGMGGGGAESDTTGELTTVNSSLLCKVEPAGDSDRGTGWVTGELVETPALPPVRSAAAMSSEVIERAWLSTDTGRSDVATRIKGCGA